MCRWGTEQCMCCGREQQLAWSVTNELWEKVTLEKEGILCLECFLEKADKKKIEVKKEDFTHLSIKGSSFIHISPKRYQDNFMEK